MEVIIDFDNINDNSKRDWLIRSLKLMGIAYKTKGKTQIESSQTIEEYNKDLEAGDAEIDKGNFIVADELKKEMKKW